MYQGLNKVAPNTNTRRTSSNNPGNSNSKIIVVAALLIGGYMLFKDNEKSN